MNFTSVHQLNWKVQLEISFTLKASNIWRVRNPTDSGWHGIRFDGRESWTLCWLLILKWCNLSEAELWELPPVCENFLKIGKAEEMRSLSCFPFWGPMQHSKKIMASSWMGPGRHKWKGSRASRSQAQEKIPRRKKRPTGLWPALVERPTCIKLWVGHTRLTRGGPSKSSKNVAGKSRLGEFGFIWRPRRGYQSQLLERTV